MLAAAGRSSKRPVAVTAWTAPGGADLMHYWRRGKGWTRARMFKRLWQPVCVCLWWCSEAGRTLALMPLCVQPVSDATRGTAVRLI